MLRAEKNSDKMENKLKMFEIATTKYNEIADMVEKIYDNSLQNISKNKVMKEYDLFIQCILLKIANENNNTSNEELEFIKKLARYKNYLKSNEDLLKCANECLATVPVFIHLLVKDENKDLNVKKFFNNLLRIIICLSNLDEEVAKEEMMIAIKSLDTIIDYFNINNVLYL